jgi:hypothetical protein
MNAKTQYDEIVEKYKLFIETRGLKIGVKPLPGFFDA